MNQLGSTEPEEVLLSIHPSDGAVSRISGHGNARTLLPPTSVPRTSTTEVGVNPAARLVSEVTLATRRAIRP